MVSVAHSLQRKASKSTRLCRRKKMINQNALTNEQIQKIAPSAFADQPYEKQSDRYSFVPTSAVIDGMRLAGLNLSRLYNHTAELRARQTLLST